MNITFIGMSGVGKSTIGKKIASDFRYKFIDIDKIIEKEKGVSLQFLLDKVGDNEFVRLEEQVILNLPFIKNTVISPGGSVIYSEKTMNYLRSISKIVYLRSSLEEIEKRISRNKELRGIVGLKNKTFTEIYSERVPLYERYADIQIDVLNKSPKIISQEIRKKIGI